METDSIFIDVDSIIITHSTRTRIVAVHAITRR